MPTAYNQLVNETSDAAPLENGLDSLCDEPGKQTAAIVLTDIEPTCDDTAMIMRPKDYLTSAVAVTMCCWLGLPLGIAALVHSRQVRSLSANGDLNQAQEASRLARTLVYMALAVGLFGWSLFIAVIIIYCLTTGDTDAVSELSTEKFAIFVPN